MIMSNLLSAQCEWCENETPRTLTMTCTSIDGPITYSWVGPNGFTANTRTISPTDPGLYVGSCTNAINCDIEESIEVIIYTPAVIEVVETDATCGQNDGSATINVTSGSISSVQWSHGPTTLAINNLAGGVYTATVIDVNGCTQVVSANIDDAGAPVLANIADQMTCEPTGSIIINGQLLAQQGTAPYTFDLIDQSGSVVFSDGSANGAATLVFFGTAANPVPLMATWSVMVTDANGCIASQSFQVSTSDLTGTITCN